MVPMMRALLFNGPGSDLTELIGLAWPDQAAVRLMARRRL
jgi:hypothetical protein